jgi:hypothetical protein
LDIPVLVRIDRTRDERGGVAADAGSSLWRDAGLDGKPNTRGQLFGGERSEVIAAAFSTK